VTAKTRPSLQELLDGSIDTTGPAIKATFGREDRRFNAEAFREFWRATRMFAVSTAGKSGAPNIAPVHVSLRDDDELEMAIFEDSVRLQDLRRDPRIAITTWGDGGAVAIVYGRCSEVEGSRREVNPGGNPELRRYAVMMRIEMTRAYAMKPAPRPTSS
jgi:predicted pyridoxine 5'-phosphate oxidase superfamily flavin-nucleotide-binding protein